ncbi:MAG: hypothetical protein ACON5A_03795 [Candidatus Comchoanobacterales bacterium]
MNTALYRLACDHLKNIVKKQFEGTQDNYVLIQLPPQSFIIDRLSATLVSHHITISQKPTLIKGLQDCVNSNYHYTAIFTMMLDGISYEFNFHAFYSPKDKLIPLNHTTLKPHNNNQNLLKLTYDEIADLINQANQQVSQTIQPLRKIQADIITNLSQKENEIKAEFYPFKTFVVPDDQLHKLQEKYQQLLALRITNLTHLNQYLNTPKKGLLAKLTELLKLSKKGALFTKASMHKHEDNNDTTLASDSSANHEHKKAQKPKNKKKAKKKKKGKKKTPTIKSKSSYQSNKKHRAPQSYLNQLTLLEQHFDRAQDIPSMIEKTNNIAPLISDLQILTLTEDQKNPLNYEALLNMATLKLSTLIEKIFVSITSSETTDLEYLRDFLKSFGHYHDLVTIDPMILYRLMRMNSLESTQLFEQLLVFFDLTNLTIFSFKTEQSLTLLEWCIVLKAPLCFKVLLSQGFTPMNIQSSDTPYLVLFSEFKPDFMISMSSYANRVFTPKFNETMKAIMIDKCTFERDIIDLHFELMKASLSYIKSFKKILGNKTANTLHNQASEIAFSAMSDYNVKLGLTMKQNRRYLKTYLSLFQTLHLELETLQTMPGAKSYLLTRNLTGKEYLIQGKTPKDLETLLDQQRFIDIVNITMIHMVEITRLRINYSQYAQAIRPDGTLEFKPQYTTQLKEFLQKHSKMTQSFEHTTTEIMLNCLLKKITFFARTDHSNDSNITRDATAGQSHSAKK